MNGITNKNNMQTISRSGSYISCGVQVLQINKNTWKNPEETYKEMLNVQYPSAHYIMEEIREEKDKGTATKEFMDYVKNEKKQDVKETPPMPTEKRTGEMKGKWLVTYIWTTNREKMEKEREKINEAIRKEEIKLNK